MKPASSLPPITPHRRWAALPVLIVAGLFVLVPLWTWYGTWFGRRLSDEQITQYLADNQKPRKIQHALSQIEQRIRMNDPAVKQWYPRVIALANHPIPEIRVTAAWVMGQDNTSEPFHEALQQMLADPEVMVQRNAALGLVRFGDRQGHPQLIEMIRPYRIQSPAAGKVELRLREGAPVVAGALVARIKQDGQAPVDVRASLPGKVSAILVGKEEEVNPGTELMSVAPAESQLWEALRALYLIGQPEDLPEIERYVKSSPEVPAQISQQAALTAEAIRRREKAAGR